MMKKNNTDRIAILIILLVFLVMFSCRNDLAPRNSDPTRNGVVCDAETAIDVATAIWLPIYGDEIYSHEPFVAELHDSIWFVTGTLRKNFVGGTPIIKISKKDGRILQVGHEL